MSDESLLPHILDLATLDADRMPQDARKMARLSLFDWMVVSLAGADQPLANIIRNFVATEGGVEIAAVTGGATRLPARAAALANGTISHALDYDDTHFAYIGHPSVAIFPAALAAAEEMKGSADDVIDAFLLGAEATCRIGMVLGRDHYDAGFHQTATSGAFGATVAAAHLYRLDRSAIRTALGLASSRASGLKSQFGTMGKPFNAGAAAANGIEAASLARLGFTASDDAFAGPQSFLNAHHAVHDGGKQIAGWSFDNFLFSSVSYKLYACCHGTHAMIEALLLLRANNPFPVDDFTEVRVEIAPRWQDVCDIKAPSTGLEIKFSYVFLAAMVLSGKDLAAYESYLDSHCDDADLVALAHKVTVVGNGKIADSAARVTIYSAVDDTRSQDFDLLTPIDSLHLSHRLQAKATALIGGRAAADLWSIIDSLEDVSASDLANRLQMNYK